MQDFYARKILKIHSNRAGMTNEDIKICLAACGCNNCLIELKNFEVNQAYMKINKEREKCKFCGKATKVDSKTGEHSCPDCG